MRFFNVDKCQNIRIKPKKIKTTIESTHEYMMKKLRRTPLNDVCNELICEVIDVLRDVLQDFSKVNKEPLVELRIWEKKIKLQREDRREKQKVLSKRLREEEKSKKLDIKETKEPITPNISDVDHVECKKVIKSLSKNVSDLKTVLAMKNQVINKNMAKVHEAQLIVEKQARDIAKKGLRQNFGSELILDIKAKGGKKTENKELKIIIPEHQNRRKEEKKTTVLSTMQDIFTQTWDTFVRKPMLRTLGMMRTVISEEKEKPMTLNKAVSLINAEYKKKKGILKKEKNLHIEAAKKQFVLNVHESYDSGSDSDPDYEHYSEDDYFGQY